MSWSLQDVYVAVMPPTCLRERIIPITAMLLRNTVEPMGIATQ